MKQDCPQEQILTVAVIYYAVIFIVLFTMQCLIKHGANVNIKNATGETALFSSIREGEFVVTKVNCPAG